LVHGCSFVLRKLVHDIFLFKNVSYHGLSFLCSWTFLFIIFFVLCKSVHGLFPFLVNWFTPLFVFTNFCYSRPLFSSRICFHGFFRSSQIGSRPFSI
jgi:hypothetical protein